MGAEKFVLDLLVAVVSQNLNDKKLGDGGVYRCGLSSLWALTIPHGIYPVVDCVTLLQPSRPFDRLRTGLVSVPSTQRSQVKNHSPV